MFLNSLCTSIPYASFLHSTDFFRLNKIIPLLLSVVAFNVAAESTSCWDIDNDSDRLACFDQLSNKDRGESSSGLMIDWKQNKIRQPRAEFSLLNERWELEEDLVEYAFRPYKPVYFFPLFYSSKLNELPGTPNPRTTSTDSFNLDHLEAKLQLSFKTKLLNDLIGENGDIWFGYTQSSRWQIYNAAESRPFRETNHEPEFMFVWRTNYNLAGFTGRLLSLSLTHQSNGQNEPLSRSWNRFILNVGFDRPDWVVQLRPWWRIPETSDEEDENPDILDFVGRGELLVVHRRRNSHQISGQIRHSFKSGEDSRGSINIDWSYPCFDRLRCHAQIFHGYGESMIDYNHQTTSFGMGVALIEWF